MQYRTETKITKGLGSEKHGFGHWWMQRLTAVLMVPLGIWFVYALMSMHNTSADALILWLHNPMPALLMTLWSLTVVYHGALGLQVIIEDYVDDKKIALSMQILLKFAMLFMLLVIFFSIVKLVS